MERPIVGLAILIVNENNEILLGLRNSELGKNTWAPPGGKLDKFESFEDCIIRETKEETNLDLVKLHQFHVYSSPERDKRRHTVSCVMRCYASRIDSLQRGDDAKAVEIIPLSKILSLDLAFDHKTILKDYINQYHPNLLTKDTDNILG